MNKHWSCVLVLAFLVPACGGSGGGTPGPSPTPNNPNRITIGSNATITPIELTVSPGTRVLFVNSDGRRHDMTSDPHPDHTDCQELNQVGLLAPGQSRETGNLVTPGTCGFHDHENPDDTRLRGRIVIR